MSSIYENMWKLELEEHIKTKKDMFRLLDSKDDLIYTLKERVDTLSKEVESLESLMETSRELNDTLLERINILENQQVEYKDCKLAKVEHYV